MRDEDLPELISTADALIAVLRDFEDRAVPGTTWYVHHGHHFARSRQLAMHLNGALRLTDAHLYPSAFALYRTALEHHLLDVLQMVGVRYVQRFGQLTDEQFETLVDEYRNNPSSQIVDEPSRSNRGHVRVVREGLFPRVEDEGPESGDSYAIPMMYFVMDRYSPFVGRPSDQGHFDDGLSDPERRVDWARENRAVYEQYLRWESIKESLVVNEYLTETETVRLEVHYRFLSAYTHAYSQAYELAYPRGIRGGTPPTWDHYSTELAGLYALVLGARELEALLTMAEQPPFIQIDRVEEVRRLLGEANKLSAHLWFPGQPPHEYDRVTEANRQSWRGMRTGEGPQHPPNPAELRENQISYYENPLHRLVQLHSSGQELTTGLVYRSPWERGDAHLR